MTTAPTRSDLANDSHAVVIERGASCSTLARHEWQTCEIEDCDECQWLVDWGMVMACDHCGSPGMVDCDGWVMHEPWLSDGACVCIGCSAQIEAAFNSSNAKVQTRAEDKL
jgi:hypothetical protein